MKILLQGFYLSLFACLLFSSCSSSLYTSNGARDQRPLLFDGEYDIKVFEPMTTAEAKAKLKSMGGAAGADNNPVAVAMFNALTESLKSEGLVEEVNPTSKTDLRMMTKIQLEDFAREFGVELDRRERKDALVKQAYKAQFDE